VFAPKDEPLDVLWKNPSIDPLANLTQLSQITGAYASATIDNEIEVQLLLNEKDDRILFLEQQLAKLQQDFQQMQLAHQSNLASKEE